MGVHALLLDLDDTLLDHRGAADAAVADWARELLDWTDAGAAASTWHRLEAECFPLFERGECSFAEQRRLRVRGFAPVLADLDDDQADALFERYLEFYRFRWRARPGGIELVERALREGWRVGVLTNGDQQQQAEKLAAIGLAGPDVALFASSTLGHAKPDPRAFERACTLLGADPADTVMVGDNEILDVLAARTAGLTAIHVPARLGSRSTGCVASLTEVIELVFGDPATGHDTNVRR